MVIHLTHTDLRFDNRIRKELIELKSEGFNVQGIGVLRKDDEIAAHHRDEAEDLIFNLNIFSYPFTKFWKPITFILFTLELSIKIFLKCYKLRPKIIHCHDTLVLPIGTLISTLYSCKLIYDAHELESSKFGQSKSLSLFTLWIEKLCWSKINHLITVSSSIGNWYNKNLGDKATTIILNSPRSKPQSSKPVMTLRQTYNLGVNDKIFIYLGGFEKGRSIELILEAFIQLRKKDYYLVFMGFGSLQNYIQEFVNKSDNILIHPPVSSNEVHEVLSNSTAGFCLIENVSLSDFYSLPNKLFEYLSANIQVIGSELPEIKDLIDKNNLGAITKLNVNNLKKAILDVGQSSNTDVNFKVIIEPYMWKCQSEKLIKLYKNL